MGNILNRKERRKMTPEMLTRAMERTEANLATILLSFWIDVLWDDGMPEEKLRDIILKVADRYNATDDLPAYRRKVYEKTGIGIVDNLK